MARMQGYRPHDGGKIKTLRAFLHGRLHVSGLVKGRFIHPVWVIPTEDLLALARTFSHPDLPSSEVLAEYPAWRLVGPHSLEPVD